MKLDEPTWKAVIDAAQIGIDEWNQRAKEKDPNSKFALRSTNGGTHQFIITEHFSGKYATDRHIVARDINTGELRKATPKGKRGKDGMQQVSVKVGPKAWEKLAGKSPKEIAGGLKLLDFLMITSVKAVESSAQPGQRQNLSHVHGFLRSDHSKNVSIIVDMGADQFGGGHAIAEKIGGPEYCFHASMNLLHSVPPDVIGVLMTTEELYSRVPDLDPNRRRRRGKG